MPDVLPPVTPGVEAPAYQGAVTLCRFENGTLPLRSRTLPLNSHGGHEVQALHFLSAAEALSARLPGPARDECPAIRPGRDQRGQALGVAHGGASRPRGGRIPRTAGPCPRPSVPGGSPGSPPRPAP